jgi:hypothetical protein
MTPKLKAELPVLVQESRTQLRDVAVLAAKEHTRNRKVTP